MNFKLTAGVNSSKVAAFLKGIKSVESAQMDDGRSDLRESPSHGINSCPNLLV
jgi:hypothetical protein